MSELKSILLLSLVIVSANTIMSQHVTFRGHIKIDRNKLPARDDMLRLRPLSSLSYPEKDTIWTIKIPINSDGSFSHVATEIRDSTLYEYDYWWLPKIFLTKDTEYELNVDVLNAQQTYHLESSNAGEENKYLTYYKWGKLPHPGTDKSPEKFRANMDSILQVEQDWLMTFDVNKAFRDLMSDQLKVDWGNRLFYYLMNGEEKQMKVDGNRYFDFVASVPVQSNASARIFNSHLTYIDRYVHFILKPGCEEISTKILPLAKRIESILPLDVSEIYLTHQFLRSLLHSSKSKTEELKDYLAYYQKRYPDGEYLELMQDKLTKRIRDVFELTIEDKRFSLMVYDTSGNPKNLQELLISQRGRVVILDIWASSCRPCIEQIPTLKQLQETYRDDNLVFISLSVEGKAYLDSHWKKCIQRNSWENWNHILMGGGFESEILKIFDSNSLPTYVVIDRKGKIYVNRISLTDHSAFKERIKELL